MKMSANLSLASIVGLALTCNHAALAQVAEKSTETKAASRAVVGLIEQLTSDSSSKRQAARDAILKAGPNAVQPLTKAAEGDDPQTAYSSVRLLGELARDEDAKVAKTAAKALKSIADGKSPSARQARKTLDEAAEPQLPGPQAGGGFPAMQNVSISTSIINGNKRTVVSEGDRTVTIVEGAQGNGIQMTVKDAKGKETTYKADNEKALEEASKEAAKLYRKYSKNNVGQMFNVRIGPGIGQAFGGGRMGAQIGGLPQQFNIPQIVMPRIGGAFGPRFRQPGEKDPLTEMARLLKDAKELTNEALDDKKRDARKLKQILDKLDHIETHLELLKRDQPF